MSKILYFNFIIKFVLEGYLELSVVTMLNIKDVISFILALIVSMGDLRR